MKALTACDALAQGRRLEVRYHGFRRVVEVHAVGVTGEDRDVMLVWQVRGGSRGGQEQGWKALLLDETSMLAVLDERSAAPRQGYAPRHSTIHIMRCHL